MRLLFRSWFAGVGTEAATSCGGFEHVHEVLNVVQGLGHGFAGAPVLVEVNVQGAGYVKQTPGRPDLPSLCADGPLLGTTPDDLGVPSRGRAAMACMICAAAPQPFSEAWRTSPAASSVLAWDKRMRLDSRYF